MKKWTIVAAAFALAAAGAFALSGLGRGGRQADPETTQSAARVDGAAHQVALLPDRAEPDTLVIKAGESIQFNSRDGQSHEMSSGKGDAFGEDHEHQADGAESGVFGPDEAYLLKFGQAGTYYFHDNLNPKLNVAVVVYNP